MLDARVARKKRKEDRAHEPLAFMSPEQYHAKFGRDPVLPEPKSEPWSDATRRARIDREIAFVRQLAAEVSTQLSSQRLEEVDELLLHDEPNEALLGIAWDLAAGQEAVREGIVRAIQQAVGDSNDLPRDFRHR